MPYRIVHNTPVQFLPMMEGGAPTLDKEEELIPIKELPLYYGSGSDAEDQM